jgi:small subunit ribosomal protein S21
VWQKFVIRLGVVFGFCTNSAVAVTSRFFIPPWEEVIKLTVVNLRSNESQDMLLKRFRKKIVKSGILSTVRRKRWFVSKSEQRRMEKKKAIRRIKRRQYKDFE